MTYDEKEIEKCVKSRRRVFLIRAAIGAAIFTVGVIFLFLNERKFIVSGGLLMLLALFVFYKTVNKYLPKWLFFKEIRGINVKEYEFVTMTPGGGYKKHPAARLAKQNQKQKGNRGPTVHAYVYLKPEGEDIKVLDGITSKQTELYEIGDELLRYKGTRYPVIVGRSVKRQPCPLCGTINEESQTRCKMCGLGILSD